MKRVFLFLFLLFCLVISISNQEISIYVRQFDLYKEFLRECNEVMILVLLDGRILVFTSGEADRVSLISLQYLAERCSFAWKDVVIAIHSHFGVPFLSPQDITCWNRMISLGFQGYFGIYLVNANRAVLFDINKAKHVYEKAN